MTTIQSLPVELLETIINSLDSADQVARCSLVSKQWNRLANDIMHTKTISVKSEIEALKLYTHLCNYRPRIPCIKHLHFELDCYELPIIIEQLLKLTVQENIKILSGSVKSDGFFKLLFKIIDAPGSSFDRLVELPSYTGINDELIVKQALRSKDSQYEFRLRLGTSRSNHYQPLFSQLDKFKNWTYLKLTGFVRGLEDLDNVLKRTSNLKTLGFENFSNTGINWRILSTEDVHQWAEEHNVTKEESLQTLVIRSDYCCPEVIDYLLYKYPKITNVQVLGRPEILPNSKKVNRIFKAIKTVDSIKLMFVIPFTFTTESEEKFAKEIDQEIIVSREQNEGAEFLVLSYE